MKPLDLMFKVQQLLKKSSEPWSVHSCLWFPTDVAKKLNVSWLEAALALRCLRNEVANVKMRNDGRWYYEIEKPVTQKSPVGCP